VTVCLFGFVPHQPCRWQGAQACPAAPSLRMCNHETPVPEKVGGRVRSICGETIHHVHMDASLTLEHPRSSLEHTCTSHLAAMRPLSVHCAVTLMYLCVRVRVRVHVRVRVRVRVCVRMCVSVCLCIIVRAYVCMHACLRTCLHACMLRTCVCVCMHACASGCPL